MPRDMHTPVSNMPEEEPRAAQAEESPVVQEPSEGTGQAAAGPAMSDIEQVEGYRRPEGTSDMAWVMPATEPPDIGEASFGRPPPLAETVHGPDDRVQITNTSIYPWRVHCYLQITAADNSQWRGTGWFIGPHTVATAGHVVHIKNSGVPGRDGWVKSISVMPGRNGNSLPYGSVTSGSFRSVTGWTGSGDENFDYGAIVLPTDLGSSTGWFGIGIWSDSDLLKTTGNIAGYPGDKAGATMWYDARGVAAVNARKVYYDIDTAGGQSGSAVYHFYNGGRYGFGVHAYGGATTNSGTRIIQPVYDNFVAWKA